MKAVGVRDGFSSFRPTGRQIWSNGEFVAWKDTKIHVLTHGLHYASPVFEGEACLWRPAAQTNRINVAMAIAIWQWGSYFNPTEKLKGIRLDIAEYRRPDPKTAPCASHVAEAKGYADAMTLDYLDQVTEATGANIFFIKDGVIHTPTRIASLTVSPAKLSSTGFPKSARIASRRRRSPKHR